MIRQAFVAMLVSVSVAGCSDTPELARPASTQASGSPGSGAALRELDCSQYDSYLAALGALTADCLGEVDPRSYDVSPDGTLRPAFSSCPAKPEKMRKISQLLSLQHRDERLPFVKECMGGRFAAARASFEARGITTCPTWEKSHVINPITHATLALVEGALPKLPASSDSRPRSIIAPGVSRASLTSLHVVAEEASTATEAVGVFDLLEENSLYVVAGESPNQACESPAACATACAAPFPGFVIGPKGRNHIVTDPVAWLLDTTYPSKAADPFLRSGYRHPMSLYGPLPGVMFADFARFQPCGEPSPDPLCGPEQCSYYAGSHLKTFLQKDCLDETDIDSCVAYCGPLLP